MFKHFTFSVLFLAVFLSGCMSTESKPVAPIIPPKITYVNDTGDIHLQNLTTRMIVICSESIYETAETCAQFYEKHDYVRFGDIPYKVAKYDRLTKDNFPTRRWRPGERTPRW